MSIEHWSIESFSRLNQQWASLKPAANQDPGSFPGPSFPDSPWNDEGVRQSCLSARQAGWRIEHLVLGGRGTPKMALTLLLPPKTSDAKSFFSSTFAPTTALFTCYRRAPSLSKAQIKSLLHQVLDYARGLGVTEVIGPMLFNTWHEYRFVSEDSGLPRFPGELSDSKLGYEDFRLAGFENRASYCTTLVDDLKRSIDVGHQRKVNRSLASLDIQIIDRAEQLAASLPLIYRLAMTSFRGRVGFQAISLEQFTKLHRGISSRPFCILVARSKNSNRHSISDSTDLGFAYSYEAGLYPGKDKPTKKPSAVLKSLAVSPNARRFGIGNALAYSCHRYWLNRGCKRMLHAYMETGNTSRVMSSHYGQVIRRYALVGVRL